MEGLAKQIASLMNNEGRRLAKEYGPVKDRIMPEVLTLIAHGMAEGHITKQRGRKLFCDIVKEGQWKP